MLLNLSLATIFLTIFALVFGQDFIFIPLSLKKCPVKGGKELKYEISLNKGEDGSKSLSLSSDLTQVLDKECTYKANFEMKNGGIYVQYMQTNGNICEVFDNVAKPAWEKFKKIAKPPIKEPCTVNPGSYSITGFQIKKDEINIPIPSKGQFRADTHAYCNNVEVACILAEFLIVEEDEDDE